MKTFFSSLIALAFLIPGLVSAASPRELMAHQSLNQEEAGPGESLSVIYLKIYLTPNSELVIPAGTPVQIEYAPHQGTAALLENPEPQVLEFALPKDLKRGSVVMFVTSDRSPLVDGHGRSLNIQVRDDLSADSVGKAFPAFVVTVRVPSMGLEFPQGLLKLPIRVR